MTRGQRTGLGIGAIALVALLAWIWRGDEAPQPGSEVTAVIDQTPVAAVVPAQVPVSEPAAPAAPVPAVPGAPIFEIVRVAPDGQTVIAGKAAPGAAVEVLLDGAKLGEEVADATGAFVAIVQASPSDVARALTLRTRVAPEVAAAAPATTAPEAAAPAVAEAAPGTEAVAPTVEPQVAATATETPAAAATAPADVTTPVTEAVTAATTPVTGAVTAVPVATDAAPATVASAVPTETAPSQAAATPATPTKSAPPTAPAVLAETAPAMPTEAVPAQAATTLATSTEAVPAQAATTPATPTETAPVQAAAAPAAATVIAPAEAEAAPTETVAVAAAPAAPAESAEAPTAANLADVDLGYIESAPVLILPSDGIDEAPVVVQSGGADLTLVQPAPTAPDAGLVLDRVTRAPDGNVVLAGRGAAGLVLRCYANGVLMSETRIGEGGDWRTQLSAKSAKGALLLRLDAIGADGSVRHRLETPFDDTDLAAATAARPAALTVQRGDNLWRLAEQVYGEGTRYSVIFAANASLIRDEDLIYPGQVFSLPALAPAQ